MRRFRKRKNLFKISFCFSFFIRMHSFTKNLLDSIDFEMFTRSELESLKLLIEEYISCVEGWFWIYIALFNLKIGIGFIVENVNVPIAIDRNPRGRAAVAVLNTLKIALFHLKLQVGEEEEITADWACFRRDLYRFIIKLMNHCQVHVI